MSPSTKSFEFSAAGQKPTGPGGILELMNDPGHAMTTDMAGGIWRDLLIGKIPLAFPWGFIFTSPRHLAA